ncbi:50S ribosomal protein L9 [Candidatus Falkowbacteria bacterium]|nr:50S ribosomal protein L9 [Candidatus Falkowbacteria bacterium]
MKVIFLKNVENVGRVGDVKEVAEGFARNFLLPQKIAEQATAAALKRAQSRVDVRQHRSSKIVKDADELLKIISKLTLSFKGKADEKGTLFAGITTEKICADLLAKGYDIKPKQLKTKGALKKLGTHLVSVNFNGKQATLRVVLGRDNS